MDNDINYNPYEVSVIWWQEYGDFGLAIFINIIYLYIVYEYLVFIARYKVTHINRGPQYNYISRFVIIFSSYNHHGIPL